MEQPTTFGEWIRQKRRALDLTQDELADRVGCSVSAIRKIEAGDRRASRQVVGLLADALRIPAEERSAFISLGRGERETLPAPAAPARKNAIPHALTPLVGREPEVTQVVHLLTSPACRWLTLTGPGGIGKTRIAIEAAQRLQQGGHFRDGVFFVGLSAVNSGDLLVSAIADTLGFTFFGPEPPTAQLARYLREKAVLLALDNFEHLVDGAGLLTELLSAAPDLKLLVTTQERLHAQAEWVLEIQGLPVPDTQEMITGEGRVHSSALELFVRTAQRADPGFALTAENQADVLRICQAVDGLPLGIELAAAWVRALTPREIAEEITRGYDFLTAQDHSLPERHKSLRAVFEHSWRLLSAEERALLARLSLMHGLMDREAARQAAGASLAQLSALVDKSLLRHQPGGYSLHELVRKFAGEHLLEDQATALDAQQRYSAYFLGLLARSESALMSPQIRAAMQPLNAALGNIRRAWEWAAANRRVELVLHATGGLYTLMEMRGAYQEGMRLFASAAEQLGGWEADKDSWDARHTLAVAQLFAKEAFFHVRLGRQGQAEPIFHMSIALLRPLVEQNMPEATGALSEALVMLATANWHMGHFEEARELAAEALELARAVFHRWNTAYALLVLALVDDSQGRTAAAYQTVQESLTHWRQVADVRGLVLGLSYAALIANDSGHTAEARAMLRECLEASRAIEDRWGEAMALNHLGQISLNLGAPEREEALAMLRESVAVYREMGEPWNMGRALIRLGEAHHQQGEDEAAAQALVEAIRIGWESPVTPLALDAMLRLAVLLADRGLVDCAARIIAPVRAHPQCYEETRERANALWATWQRLPDAQPAAGAFDAMVEQVLDWSGSLSTGPCEEG